MRVIPVLATAAVVTLALGACTGPTASPSGSPAPTAAGTSEATTPGLEPSTSPTAGDATSGPGSSVTTGATEGSGATSGSSAGTESESGGLSSSVDTGTSNVQSSVEVRVAEIISDYEGQVTDRGTALTIPGEVLFDTDEDTLRPRARQDLDKVVEVLDFYGGAPVEIVGHTDSRSSDSYNQDLSERRARSVADYLRDAGVDGARLEVSGRGESEPVASNDTAEGRQRNRRVVVTVVGVEPPDPE